MKKNIRNLIYFIVLSILLSGCTIKQEVYFNRNFSGRYKYSYDFTQLLKYTEDINGTSEYENDYFEEYLSVVKEELSAIKGVSRIKIINNTEKGMISFSFKFKNLDVLNQAIRSTGNKNDDPLANASFFIKDENGLTYERKPLDIEYTEDEMDIGLYNSIKCISSINFRKSVKEFEIQNDPGVTVSDNKKEFVENCNLYEGLFKNVRWTFVTK